MIDLIIDCTRVYGAISHRLSFLEVLKYQDRVGMSKSGVKNFLFNLRLIGDTNDWRTTTRGLTFRFDYRGIPYNVISNSYFDNCFEEEDGVLNWKTCSFSFEYHRAKDGTFISRDSINSYDRGVMMDLGGSLFPDSFSLFGSVVGGFLSQFFFASPGGIHQNMWGEVFWSRRNPIEIWPGIKVDLGNVSEIHVCGMFVTYGGGHNTRVLIEENELQIISRLPYIKSLTFTTNLDDYDSFIRKIYQLVNISSLVKLVIGLRPSGDGLIDFPQDPFSDLHLLKSLRSLTTIGDANHGWRIFLLKYFDLQFYYYEII